MNFQTFIFMISNCHWTILTAIILVVSKTWVFNVIYWYSFFHLFLDSLDKHFQSNKFNAAFYPNETGTVMKRTNFEERVVFTTTLELLLKQQLKKENLVHPRIWSTLIISNNNNYYWFYKIAKKRHFNTDLNLKRGFPNFRTISLVLLRGTTNLKFKITASYFGF